MTRPESIIPKKEIDDALLAAASKFNQVVIWPFLPIFMIASALEFYFVPEYWDLFFYTRLGTIAVGLLCILLYLRNLINSYWMMGITLTVMGLHCSLFYLLSGPEYLLQTNLAYFVYFVSMGTFALFPPMQRLLSIGGTLVSGLLFLAFNDAISFEQWVLEGGVIILLGAPISYFLVRFRMDSLISGIQANLQIEQSQKLLDQKNQSLEKAKAELENYNLKLESEVAKRTRSLKRSNQERDAMVYRLSHDFKSPMINIRSLVLLAQEERDPQQQAQLFALIDKSILKFESLIGGMDQFVVYALEDSETAPLQLSKVIGEVWTELQSKFPSEMELEIEPGLPTTFISQQAKLEMVLEALFKNAIQFRKDEGQPKLIVSSRQQGDFFFLTLQDNGRGIPANLQEKVSHLFFRGDTSSEGLGVGLYLATGCMEQLGGTLTIQPVAEGTKVELKFPFSPQHS